MRFASTEKEQAAAYAEDYLRTLRGGVGAVYAAFCVARGVFYAVTDGDEEIGAVNVRGNFLSAMLLRPDRLRRAPDVFAAAKETFGIDAAAAYPDDYSILSAASVYRPRIEPMAYTYEYKEGLAALPQNPHKPLTKAWMRVESELCDRRGQLFLPHELICETDTERAMRCDWWSDEEIEAAVADRRFYTLGEIPTAAGLIREVPFADDKWDLSVWVAPSCRQKGYGAALLRALAVLTLDYHKLPIACVGADSAAAATLSRAGFINTANALKLIFG